MTDLARVFFRRLFRRHVPSELAFCSMIEVAEHLTIGDMKQMSEYLRSYAELKAGRITKDMRTSWGNL